MILKTDEARAVKDAAVSLSNLVSFFTITIGEGGAAATIEFDEGIITLKNSKVTELYGDIESFAEKYGI